MAADGSELEVIFVNDGSRDGGEQASMALPPGTSDSRSFIFTQFRLPDGYHREHASSGAPVSVMDADLKTARRILAFLPSGGRVSRKHGVREARVGRPGSSFLPRIFYRIIRRLTNVESPWTRGLSSGPRAVMRCSP